MDGGKFVVQAPGDRPWRIELREDALSAGAPQGRRLDEMRLTYPTQGCPARISPGGGSSAIATLWSWSVDLARQAGLLGAVGETGEEARPDAGAVSP